MNKEPLFLLINPWIYDFAAFDLFLKPLGLLSLAGNLKKLGCDIIYLDCMNRLDHYFKKINYTNNKKYGTGKFYYEVIKKPEILKFIPRYYKRYGLPLKQVKSRLNQLKEKKIDAVLITSVMTYWYPGVFDMIRMVNKILKGIPVILGGIYATLMPEHAKKYSGADHIIVGTDISLIIKKIFSLLKINKCITPINNLREQEEPLFDLYPELTYLTVQLSRGCAFACTYCASKLLWKDFHIKNINKVAEKARYYVQKYNIRDIAFYDDALLFNFPEMLKKFLDNLKDLKINYHTPNGLHINLINQEIAECLYKYHFKILRLSFESSSIQMQKKTGKIITTQQFKKSIQNLLHAGFSEKDLEVYVLFGYPEQKYNEVADTVKFIKDHGAQPKLVEYSLIPGTKDHKRYFNNKFIDPLLTNNSVFFQKFTSLTYKDLRHLRELANK